MTKETSTEESGALEAETERAGRVAKFVVIFPDGLAKKLKERASDEDKLPTELVREIVRESIENPTTECEDCGEDGVPNEATHCPWCGIEFAQDDLGDDVDETTEPD
jgi:hypothetical protein